MSLEADSAFTLIAVWKQSAMDTSSGLLRTWYAHLLCYYSVRRYGICMRTVVGVLVFGRRMTCITLDFSERRHPAIWHNILLVVLLSLCCVPSYPVPHMRCFSIDIMTWARWTTFSHIFLALCCVSSCLVRSLMLVFHREMIVFYMRTFVDISALWRHTTCVPLDCSGRRHQAMYDLIRTCAGDLLEIC